MAFQKRGQGSTEYLVLLAVVLIIALVSIALLGFFPGLSTDAKITQSASYWKGARPFAVLEHKLTTAGTGSLVMQNMDATGSATINNITLTSAAGTGTANTSIIGASFAPGEIRTIPINASVGTSSVGQVYDLQVTIYYTTSNSINTVQYGGAKTLVGKYS